MERDCLLTSDIIFRVMQKGVDCELSLDRNRKRSTSDLSSFAGGMRRVVQMVPSIEEDQFECFLNRLDMLYRDVWNAGEDEEEDEVPSRERLLALRLPREAFEPFLSDIEFTRPELFNLIQTHISYTGKPNQKKRVKMKRQRRGEKRERARDVGNEEGSSEGMGERRFVDKPSPPQLLACVVAKAVADNSVASYLLAVAVLLRAARGEGASSGMESNAPIPVGNVIASVFEGACLKGPESPDAYTFHNPFRACLLSSKDEQAKSVSCSDVSEYQGTLDEASLVALQSDAGSTAGSMNADHGTETASIIEAEVDELTEEEMLAHAMALSLGMGSSSSSSALRLSKAAADTRDFQSVSSNDNYVNVLASIPESLPDIKSLNSFTPLCESGFWSNLYCVDNASGAGLTAVPIPQTILALLMCISASIESALKEDFYDESKVRFPSLTSSLAFNANPMTFQLAEAVLSDLYQIIAGDTNRTFYSSLSLRWALWVIIRLLRACFVPNALCSSLLLSSSGLDASIIEAESTSTYRKHMETMLSSITGFYILDLSSCPVIFGDSSYLLSSDDITSSGFHMSIDAVKLSAADLCVQLYSSTYSTEAMLLRDFRDTLLVAPMTSKVNADIDLNRRKILAVQGLCWNLLDNIFAATNLSAHLRNQSLLRVAFPPDFDVHSSSFAPLSHDGKPSLEEVLLNRLEDSQLRACGAELFHGELSLLVALQQIRIRAYQNIFSDDDMDQKEMRFNSRRCHADLRIQANGKEVLHMGPKAWASVVVQEGFQPKSGVHEFTVRIDKCDKGHTFVGIVTAEAAVETYVGGDKFGWGMIGTRAGIVLFIY